MIPKVMYSETITGTPQENVVAHEIKHILEDIGVDDVKLQPVNVLSWREEECFIETPLGTMKCHALPYSLSADLEAPIVFAGYIGDKIYVNNDVSGKIVIIPFPEDPDDAKYVVNKLFANNVVAVVFYDENPGRYRRIVVTGVNGFPFEKGLPPLIPVVSIRKEDKLFIMKKRVTTIRLYVRTSIVHDAVGYNVEGIINGSTDEEVLVTAHHDHWFTGFSDNLIGVNAILWVAKRFTRERMRKTLRIISFTAEESGAPNYAGWYWSWGSRCYIKNRFRNIDKIYAVINIDAVFMSKFRISANPCLYKSLFEIGEKHGVTSDRIELDSPYFDSFMFTLNGIPALTIHTLQELRLNYHTNLDDGKEVSEETIVNLNKLVENIVYTLCTRNVYGLDGFYYEVAKYLENKEDLPLEARILLNKFKQLTLYPDKIDMAKIIRLLTRSFVKTYAIHSINGDFSSIFIPALAYIKLTESLYEDSIIKDDVFVVGEEKLLLPGVEIRHNEKSMMYNEIKKIYRRMFINEIRKAIHVLDEIVLNTIKH